MRLLLAFGLWGLRSLQAIMQGMAKFKKKPAGRPPRKKPSGAGGPKRKVAAGRRPAGARPRAKSGPWKPDPSNLAVDGDAPTANMPGERLQKILAASGIASRRECEELITEGRVEVDGQVVTELGVRVDRSRQEIRVDGEKLARPKLVYFAVNKPTGVVTTARDPAGRPRVTDLLPPSLGRVFPVGRLDMESEGLILLTNDGDLAERLTHPRHGVHKVYEVQVAGFPDPKVLEQLRRGVHLSEGYAHAVDVRVRGTRKRSTILEMVLDEGRNREIRRLLARVGHKVQRLTRIAVGPIRLGELPLGAYRRLTPEELRKLSETGRGDAREVAQRPERRVRKPAAFKKPFTGRSGDSEQPRKFSKGPRKKPAARGGDSAVKRPERRIIGEILSEDSGAERSPATNAGARGKGSRPFKGKRKFAKGGARAGGSGGRPPGGPKRGKPPRRPGGPRKGKP